LVLPNASSLNYVAGKTVANMVIARIGVDGAVNFYNSAGTTHVIVDVVGWLPPNIPLALTQLTLVPGVAGHAYSAPIGAIGSQSPYNFSATDVAPGLVLANSGTFSGTPSTPGTTSTRVDVSDRFGRTGRTTLSHNIFPASSNFVALAPTTVLDTLTEPGPIGANQTRQITVGGVGGVPASGAVPVLGIAVLSYDIGYMAVYPAGSSQPSSSHFALDENSYDSDVVVVPLGAAGAINLYTSQQVHVRVDVLGYLPTAGSFSPAIPFRILDTRSSGAIAAVAQRDVAVPGGATDVLAIVSTLSATARCAAGTMAL
jgi:hypothetical protein